MILQVVQLETEKAYKFYAESALQAEKKRAADAEAANKKAAEDRIKVEIDRANKAEAAQIKASEDLRKVCYCSFPRVSN